MKRFFLINIILLTFCVCDTDIVTYNTYHFYDNTKVELLDQYTFDTSDVYETQLLKTKCERKNISETFVSQYSYCREILKNQRFTFQNIRINLLSFFTTSHHTTKPPSLLS